ncbi:hypothetical protein [Natrialba sp. SSL1]|uniref:hypothetical protein n=1 Tax=Natrialba sp. SSL1 TaxID=1869245 RepID=UPI00111456A7|nr:hypothetical protein [Natrialba sp. SSL1]
MVFNNPKYEFKTEITSLLTSSSDDIVVTGSANHDEGYAPLGPMQVTELEDTLDDEVVEEFTADLRVDGDSEESVTLVEDGEEVYDEIDHELVDEDSNVQFSDPADPTIVSDEDEVSMVYNVEIDESEIDDRTEDYTLGTANVVQHAVGDQLFDVTLNIPAEAE